MLVLLISVVLVSLVVSSFTDKARYSPLLLGIVGAFLVVFLTEGYLSLSDDDNLDCLLCNNPVTGLSLNTTSGDSLRPPWGVIDGSDDNGKCVEEFGVCPRMEDTEFLPAGLV